MALTACVSSSSLLQSRYAAEVRRTSFNIPHIKAADEAGLGYGLGYAYAQDNVCLLADELVTVRGQRSKYFGPAEWTLDRIPNLESDYFYRLMNDDASVETAWARQPPHIQALLEGYAAGFNRYLRETSPTQLPAACRNAGWVGTICTQDLMRLVRRYMLTAGAGSFIRAISTAAPSAPAETAVNAADFTSFLAEHSESKPPLGSNAIALGRDASANGRGLLLANPHFPWRGALRFYQMHLTIPGKLDVMGASLAGFPVVNIGFNRHIAWSHTVNTSAHFTLFRLTLDPADPLRYIVDGQSRPLTRRTVSVEVRQADGSVLSQSRNLYLSEAGPLLVVPGRFEWTREQAFAIRDANEANDRAIHQWYEMNLAQRMSDFESSVRRINGIPWVNTIATSAEGEASFLAVSVVPHVTRELQSRCTPSQYRPLANAGMFVLDGSRSDCAWIDQQSAAQPGTFPSESLPSLRRVDYVQNSNDSAWLTNPAEPLTDFPAIVSRDREPLNLRTRFALSEIRAKLSATAGNSVRGMNTEDLAAMVFGNRVYLADLVMRDVLTLCEQGMPPGAKEEAAAAFAEACKQLTSWDLTAGREAGLGYLYFELAAASLMRDPSVWAVPFDSAAAVTTPRGLKIHDAALSAQIRKAFVDAAKAVVAEKLSSDTRWGVIQGFTQGAETVPVHGGSGDLGVYNAIGSAVARPGVREVRNGTSYLQIVAFEEQGVRAQALLTYSQSSDPQSPHALDQTRRFSDRHLISLPFTEEQIRNDSGFVSRSIAE